MYAKAVPPLAAHHIEVVDMGGSGPLSRRRHAVKRAQPLPVQLCESSPHGVVLVKIRKLRRQDGRLQLIQTAIHPSFANAPATALSVRPNSPKTLGELAITGHHRT